LPRAAVRFPLRHPAVACVLAGMRSAEEAATNCRLVDGDLDAATWKALDAVPPVIG
jgi:D-threo-aldose 1-dehydrogenase